MKLRDTDHITAYTCIGSPIGPLTLGAAGDCLALVRRGGLELGRGCGRPGVLEEAAAQLQEYFAGARREFDLPLRLEGTPFEREVWRALRGIPYGRTLTYGELAAELGRPKAYRAVGGACGRNPALVIVPCHRMVAQKGLGGFAAGLEAKRTLLEIEGKEPY